MVFFKRNFLLAAVFITGACVLIIEITATRILSPYYGNTIFTVSSIIGVILAALSLGYYIGGKLADRHPSLKLFFAIILFSGFSVFFLQFLNMAVLPILGYQFSITTGPLISAVIIFFLPAFLLGTLSPFAIKLQSMFFSSEGIGSVSGKVFFWSTLGSIFGSLITGFVLIPSFGINYIILSVGLVLFLIGLISLFLLEVKKKTISLILLFLAVILIPIYFSQSSSDVIYEKDGVYEKIIIYDAEYNGRATRFFQQDKSSSGAMYLDSDELVYEYTKYYSLYKIFKPDIKQALVIGGGVYSVPKALLEESPSVLVDVAEIEPSLFDLAKKYFNVSDDDRLKNFIEDGRRFLHDSNKEYDLIFSDVYYSLFSIPAHFTTKEFFEIAKEKISKDGVFVANMIGDLSRQTPSFIMSEIRTFQEVFPNSYFFAVDSPKKIGLQNIIFLGCNSNKIIDFNNEEIALKEKIINLDRYEFSAYPILTDNFAPVDYLIAKFLQREYWGNEMLAIIDQQLRYGPRYLTSLGHKEVLKFLIAEIEEFAHEVKIQTFSHEGHNGKHYELSNVIASFYPEKENRIILATHYDSKRFADKDKRNPTEPVPGANDSASGVAVLLQVAHIIFDSEKAPNVGIDIIFFDGEEGEEEYIEWQPLGSKYFAEHLDEIYPNKKPISALVLDMVCDKDLRIFKEQSSVDNAKEQVDLFWESADDVFKDDICQEIRNDHTYLNKAGIPSFLVIDFEYPYFHTTKDTIDKCSGKSLQIVAEAVLNYIYLGL